MYNHLPPLSFLSVSSCFFPIVSFFFIFVHVYFLYSSVLTRTIDQETNNLLSMIILDPSVLQAQYLLNKERKKRRKEFRIIE